MWNVLDKNSEEKLLSLIFARFIGVVLASSIVVTGIACLIILQVTILAVKATSKEADSKLLFHAL
jgi:hypothetical protein